MTGRVAIVPLTRARELAVAIGLSTSTGNRTMFSILLRNLKTPVEDGVASWPPDGAVPASAEG